MAGTQDTDGKCDICTGCCYSFKVELFKDDKPTPLEKVAVDQTFYLRVTAVKLKAFATVKEYDADNKKLTLNAPATGFATDDVGMVQYGKRDRCEKFDISSINGAEVTLKNALAHPPKTNGQVVLINWTGTPDTSYRGTAAVYAQAGGLKQTDDAFALVGEGKERIPLSINSITLAEDHAGQRTVALHVTSNDLLTAQKMTVVVKEDLSTQEGRCGADDCTLLSDIYPLTVYISGGLIYSLESPPEVAAHECCLEHEPEWYIGSEGDSLSLYVSQDNNFSTYESREFYLDEVTNPAYNSLEILVYDRHGNYVGSKHDLIGPDDMSAPVDPVSVTFATPDDLAFDDCDNPDPPWCGCSGLSECP